MVGVPDSDLIDWQMRRRGGAPSTSAAVPVTPSLPKRPRIEKVPLTAEQLRAQLKAHKALMSGAGEAPSAPVQTNVPDTAAATLPSQSGAHQPPTGVSAQGPPPTPAPEVPPTSGFSPTAPSGYAPPAPSAPPALSAPPAPSTPSAPAAAQPASKGRLAYSDPELCPEEKMALLPRYAYVESSEPAASVTQHRTRPSAAELF